MNTEPIQEKKSVIQGQKLSRAKEHALAKDQIAVNSLTSSKEAGCYEIIVEGYLDQHWGEWLGGLEFTYDNQGFTLLSGIIQDQSALHGVLSQIHNLGVALVSLRRVDGNKDRLP